MTELQNVLVGYTVTYSERRNGPTSTYRFDVDAGRDCAQANADAWAFMRAIDRDGGNAGYPAPVWRNRSAFYTNR